MRGKEVYQVSFSGLLFDTLFGLILFFGLDSFLDITSAPHFIFYLFATIVVIHWWLLFKSADDAFGDEVEDSASDIVFGIIDLLMLEYILLYAKTFQYTTSTWFLVGLLMVDLCWALIWRYVGKWDTTDRDRIGRMERELDRTIRIDIAAAVLFSMLGLFGGALATFPYVAVFVLAYVAYIILTFRTGVLNLRIF